MFSIGDLFGWILRGVCVTVNHTSNAKHFRNWPDKEKNEQKKAAQPKHNCPWMCESQFNCRSKKQRAREKKHNNEWFALDFTRFRIHNPFSYVMLLPFLRSTFFVYAFFSSPQFTNIEDSSASLSFVLENMIRYKKVDCKNQNKNENSVAWHSHKAHSTRHLFTLDIWNWVDRILIVKYEL